MRTITKAATAAIITAGLVAGAPALSASAHHATLTKSVACGTEYGTYDILVHLANSEGDKVMTVTASDIGFIAPGDTVAEGATRDYSTTVSGQWVGGGSVSVAWPNGVTATASANVTADEYPACTPPPPIKPEQPEPVVTVTSTEVTDCTTELVKVTTTTTTVGTVFDEAGNVWVATDPVVVVTTATRPATAAELNAAECPPTVKPEPYTEAEVIEYGDCETGLWTTITQTDFFGHEWNVETRTWVPVKVDYTYDLTTRDLTTAEREIFECPVVVVPPTEPPVVTPPTHTTPPGSLVVTGTDSGQLAALGGTALALLFGGAGALAWRFRRSFV